MNREMEDQLPMMQVGFIDSICMPIYEVGGSMCKHNRVLNLMKLIPLHQAFSVLSMKLVPLVEGVRENKHQWLMLADAAEAKNKSALPAFPPALTAATTHTATATTATTTMTTTTPSNNCVIVEPQNQLNKTKHINNNTSNNNNNTNNNSRMVLNNNRLSRFARLPPICNNQINNNETSKGESDDMRLQRCDSNEDNRSNGSVASSVSTVGSISNSDIDSVDDAIATAPAAATTTAAAAATVGTIEAASCANASDAIRHSQQNGASR